MIRDREPEVLARWQERARRYVRATVSDEMIAEHARSPLGQHSAELDRVLAYFRRQPLAGKYVILADSIDGPFRVGRLSGRRGQLPETLPDESYPTEHEAMHAVFLRRVQDAREGAQL